MKIAAKREHDVVGPIVAGLKEHVFDEGVHTLLHVIIKQIWVILEREIKGTCILYRKLQRIHKCLYYRE